MLQKLNALPKRWLLVVAATALLSVGLTAGVIAAAGFDPAAGPVAGKAGDYAGERGRMMDEDSRLLRRVAEIINVDAATLSAAFDTALNELANEEFASKMNELVADGTLTAEQSAAATAWFNARPADAGHIAFMGVMEDNTEQLSLMLAEGVSEGFLTQADADAIIAWHRARPDFIPSYGGWAHDGHRKGKHHRGGDADSRHTDNSNTDDSAVGNGNTDTDGDADDSAADTDSAANADADADSGN